MGWIVEREVEWLDRRTMKLMTMCKAPHQKSGVESMYVARRKGGSLTARSV